MRIIVVVDLAKRETINLPNDGLNPDFQKIKTKLPAVIEHLYCGGRNQSSIDIANLIALHNGIRVTTDKRLQDIEVYFDKLNLLSGDKKSSLQRMISGKETISLCMHHLQEFISQLKAMDADNVLVVCNHFACQLLLTYALGISIDSVNSFNINPGSVILLDIHAMTSMNKIHF